MTENKRGCLAILFEPATDAAGALDGRAVSEIPASLPRDVQALARLMREAGDAFSRARAEVDG